MGKKMAPILITIIAVLYFFIWGSLPFAGAMGPTAFIFMLIAALLICVLIVNLIKRIREINEEEEEDISKY